MEIFLDTAKIDEIREILPWGCVRGITTNPKLGAAAGRPYIENLEEIFRLFDGPISVEVTTNEYEPMLREARALAALGPNAVVKVPMNPAGLRVGAILRDEGIKTNVTAVISLSQALLAAGQGATYLSVFWGRVTDAKEDPAAVVRGAGDLIRRDGLPTRIIVGSVRKAAQVAEAFLAGAHVVTVPHKFFAEMVRHPKTEETIAEFLRSYAEAGVGRAG